MAFNGTVIDKSPTFCAEAGAAITGGPFTAVAFSEGKLVPCTASLVPMGITIAETDTAVAPGDDVYFQIKDVGVWKAGGEFAAGDALASDDNGCAVKADAGKFILGFALGEASAVGQPVKVQITKSGYAAAAAVAG